MTRPRVLLLFGLLALCLFGAPARADDDLNAAITAFNLRRFDQVIAIADHMLSARETVVARYLRGAALAESGERAAAMADLTRARTLAVAANDPMAATLDRRVIGLDLDTGDLEAALRVYGEAKEGARTTHELDVAMAAAITGRAALAQRLGRTGEAAAWLERGGELVVTCGAELYAQAGQAMLAAPTVDWARVEADAGQAIIRDPFSARAHYVEARVQLARGQRAEALARLLFAATQVRGDVELSAALSAALTGLDAASGAQPGRTR